MDIIKFLSNYEDKYITNIINDNVPKIAKTIGQEASYSSEKKTWTIFENSIPRGSIVCDIQNRKITFSHPSLLAFIERLIASIGESIIFKIKIDGRSAAFSKEYCDALIDGIVINRLETTFKPFDIWRILVETTDLNLEIERERTILKNAVVLTQELLNQYNEEIQSQGINRFHEITAIDTRLFQPLEKHRLYEILQQCPHIIVELLHNGTSYHIPVSEFLKCHMFNQSFFGEFANRSFTYKSGRLQFPISVCSDSDSKNEDLFTSFLKALEEVHLNNFEKWSLPSLALAYLGADLCGHIQMQERLLNKISDRKLGLEEELARITLFLLSVDKDLYSSLWASLAHTIFQSKSFLQKMSLENLLSFLKRDPALLPSAARSYTLPLTKLESLYSETTRELCFGDITLTQKQMSEMAKLGITESLELKAEGLLEKFKSIPFSDLPPVLQSNIFFIEMVVTGRSIVTDYTRDKMSANKLIILQLIEKNVFLLQFASTDLQNDRDIVFTAVQKNGMALQFASTDLQNDREIVFTAVKQNGMAFQYASKALWNDPEIVLAAVKQNGRAFEYTNESLRNDREIVLAAVRQRGSLLKYASKTLQDDREIVLTAVKQNGWALEYASESLRNDREIVLAAVKQGGSLLKYASESLRDDREIVLAAVKQNGWALEYASESLRNDPEIVLAAVKQSGLLLKYASESLRDDREIVLAAVKQNGWALEYASESLRNDPEIVLAAAKQKGSRIQYADRDIVPNVVQEDGLAIQYVTKAFRMIKRLYLLLLGRI